MKVIFKLGIRLREGGSTVFTTLIFFSAVGDGGGWGGGMLRIFVVRKIKY